MTTALAAATNLPTDPNTGLTLPLSKHLGSQALAQHRAMLAMECEFLAKKFDRFGWERERNTPSQDRQMLDFMDALQDFPIAEVQAACKAAVLLNPNKMPNEGHVRAEIMKARAAIPKPTAKVEPHEERVLATSEQREAILAELGMTRARIRGVPPRKVLIQRAPSGPSAEELRGFIEDVARQVLPDEARSAAVQDLVNSGGI